MKHPYSAPGAQCHTPSVMTTEAIRAEIAMRRTVRAQREEKRAQNEVQLQRICEEYPDRDAGFTFQGEREADPNQVIEKTRWTPISKLRKNSGRGIRRKYLYLQPK